MIPVMIVDDEFIVRVALKSIVDWESLGYTIVAEAKNGEEGIEKFREYRPALILTDVAMPGMSGLEMMAAIKQIDNNVCFVVLSAYEDFTFARKALQLSADEYLLKASMMEDDVEALLRRLFNNLSKSPAQIKPILAKEIIEQWCKAKITPGDTQKIWDFAFHGKPASRIYCCHLIGSFENAVKKQEMVVSLVHNIMDNTKTLFLLDMHTTNIFIMTEEINMTQTLELIKSSITRYFGASTIIGVSNQINPLDNLNDYTTQALQASLNAIFTPEKLYVEFHSQMQFSYDTSNTKLISEFQDALKITAHDEALKTHHELFELIRQKQNYKFLYSTILSICAVLSHFSDLEKMNSNPENILQLESIDKMEAAILQNLQNTLTIIATLHPKETTYIKEAKKYIEENYAQNLTLKLIAAHLHITSNYLGRLFFDQTHTRIMDYLNEVRIAAACDLMATKDLSLLEISEKVGFTNQSYFSACFLKLKKTSPREYRKHHLTSLL